MGRLKKAPKREAALTRAERNIKWCEDFLYVPEGMYVGKPLRLAEFMKQDFYAIYDNPQGTRRAIISRARKNSKTTESAMLLLLHLCGKEASQNTQLYSLAQSRDQAALLFNLAAKMIRMNPDLDSEIIVRDSKKELVCPHFGTTYRALSAEATTAWGLSPAFTVMDELGQVRGPRSSLYEALETATAAQAEPLTVIISTQAATDNDLLSILIDDALAGHDPHTIVRLNTAPLDLDPFSMQALEAANPAFNEFMNRDEVLAMVENARRMSARQAEFENYVLNRRVEANNPFVSAPRWKACNAPVGDLTAVPVYGGLDLSAVNDLTALCLIGRIGKVWHVRPTFWLPATGLRERAVQDRVPYDLWAQEGHLQTTPGNSISYEYVAQELFALFQKYDIRKLAFDRWGFPFLKPWLIKAGFTEAVIEDRFVEVGQGTQTMSPALRDLEQAILEGELAHGDHPVLASCALNAVVEGKDYANRRLSKNKSSGRIDGMVALADAFAVAPIASGAVDISGWIG
jgi:phage terminase large subunit-like protein